MANKDMPNFMKGKKGKAGKNKPPMNNKMAAKGGKQPPTQPPPMGKKVPPFGSRY